MFKTKNPALENINLTDTEKTILAAGGWTSPRPDLETILTPGWKPGWVVQLRINPRNDLLETVCGPSAHQRVILAQGDGCEETARVQH